MTTDFFLYFVLACFLIVMLWAFKWIFQIFCQTNHPSNGATDHVTPDQLRQRRPRRIRRSELVPPPPPPYTWQGDISDVDPSSSQLPRINIFTVSGNQVLIPEDSKLPKYEEIFPAGPPSPPPVTSHQQDLFEQRFGFDRTTSQDEVLISSDLKSTVLKRWTV